MFNVEIVPTGFEPVSGEPESPMLGHYTTGLSEVFQTYLFSSTT